MELGMFMKNLLVNIIESKKTIHHLSFFLFKNKLDQQNMN